MSRKQLNIPGTDAASMVDDVTRALVEQVTQRKLKFAQQLLEDKKLPHTGDRQRTRDRLYRAIENKAIHRDQLQLLLEELDAWGDQRLRILRFHTQALADYRTPQQIEDKALKSGMKHLVRGEVALIPPDELTPMSIDYFINDDSHLCLRLVAAKTRRTMEHQPDIPPKYDDDYPGVIFVPYKEETQKAVYFAEINLENGWTIVSVARTRHFSQYDVDYEAFFNLFASFIMLQHAGAVDLWRANSQICQLLPTEVRLVGRQSKTHQGGTIENRSHHASADMRLDPEHTLNHAAPGVHCNCYWECQGRLAETVHTHIYAPKGDITILGQITENSARYVLRRILELN